jgi:hypothetical protein
MKIVQLYLPVMVRLSRRNCAAVYSNIVEDFLQILGETHVVFLQ